MNVFAFACYDAIKIRKLVCLHASVTKLVLGKGGRKSAASEGL